MTQSSSTTSRTSILFKRCKQDLADYCSEFLEPCKPVGVNGTKLETALGAVASVLARHDIVLFTKLGCSHCLRAKKLLKTMKDDSDSGTVFTSVVQPITDSIARRALKTVVFTDEKAIFNVPRHLYTWPSHRWNGQFCAAY